MGRIIPYIIENKTCFKPSTRYIYIIFMTSSHLPHVSHVLCGYEKEPGSGTPRLSLRKPSKTGGFELLKLFTKKGVQRAMPLLLGISPPSFFSVLLTLVKLTLCSWLWQDPSPAGVPGGFQTYGALSAHKSCTQNMREMLGTLLWGTSSSLKKSSNTSKWVSRFIPKPCGLHVVAAHFAHIAGSPWLCNGGASVGRMQFTPWGPHFLFFFISCNHR